MSAIKVRGALEVALAAITPALDTAYENRAHTPTAGTPYQRVNVLFGTPENTENSPSYDEVGFVQVTLCYPTKDSPGSGPVTTRAELIRTTFRRGITFATGGVTTTIMRTPEIMPAFIDGDRFCVPVRIQFRAQIQL